MLKIASFFNDSGPSNNLLSIVKKYEKEYVWYFFVYKNSPAFKIFQNAKLPIIEIDENSNITDKLKKISADIVLVGTSWQNKTHLEFIKIAKALHIPSIAFLEHWVNYRERFGYPQEFWKENLADFTTLNDEYGYEMAKDLGFSNIIKLRFDNLLDDIKIFEMGKIEERNSLLFISEPTKKVAYTTFGDENYWGFDEFRVCEEICKNMDNFSTSHLTIRLHPSDETQKYDYLIQKYPNLNIEIENPYETPLIESLCKNKIIIGIDGFVLFEAMAIGKLSISFMPSLKRECVVPIFKQNKITTFENLKLADFKTKNSLKEIKSFGIDFASMVKKIANEKK
ncbi:MAG: hypothetical protein PHQ93_05625 [Sulfurimonas sp.]|uniref:hypothetical protein n=1 Tax=Sulfurimonas sp. TaxID=2022749 RepID=UPI002614EF01|nr:hypothetical protein [Sulfurimonas sp.]MDD5400650.1 hypothetical protein [Sulfurimonas sp.]